MRKRIRLHELKVGMFIEELDGTDPLTFAEGGFSIRSHNDLDLIVRHKAMSVLINTQKGVDVDRSVRSGDQSVRSVIEKGLLETYSRYEVARASETLEKSRARVQELFTLDENREALDMDAAVSIVKDLADCTADAPGAFVTLVRLKEADESTFIHSLSVSALMVTFGQSLRLSADAVQQLGIGGLLHDIGKLTVAPEILNKAGKLTKEEVHLIRRHPETGHAMLSGMQNISPHVLNVCLYHHERFDGSGYPRGLSGDEIPACARIAAICDVFDALTSIRSYKSGWSQGDAVRLMRSSDGHFDKGLLASFVTKMKIRGVIS